MKISILALLNAVVWIVPSDVVELVARDRQTLLGFYSREHMTLNLVVLFASLIGAYLEWGPGPSKRRRWFQVIAVALVSLPALGIIDLAARSMKPVFYVKNDIAYHRTPNQSFVVNFEDRPEAIRTYPDAPEGFGTVACRYSTDARGYRNRGVQDAYDIVVLGDSFVEGSKVADEHPWSVQLAERTGWSIYNLGMSGYAPMNSHAALETYGLKLSPKVVLCMIYEGNDFRGPPVEKATGRPPFTDRLQTYFKQSPVVEAVDRLMIRVLAPIGADLEVAGLEMLSWMPVVVPAKGRSTYYAFAPKQLLQNLSSPERFRESRQWRHVAKYLELIDGACRDADAQLVIVYAPVKAHVVLPLVKERLDPKSVHAFAAIRTDEDDLPSADELFTIIFDRQDAKEEVTRAWCESSDVPFISTTDALRQSVAAGEQAYYTYDQHWTPIGHEVVAETILRQLPGQVVDRSNVVGGTASFLGDGENR